MSVCLTFIVEVTRTWRQFFADVYELVGYIGSAVSVLTLLVLKRCHVYNAVMRSRYWRDQPPQDFVDAISYTLSSPADGSRFPSRYVNAVEVRLLRKTRWFLALTPSLYWKTMRRRRRVTTGGDSANDCGVAWVKHDIVHNTVRVQADPELLAQLVASGDVVITDEYLFEVSGRLRTHWLWPNVVLEAFVFTPDMIINSPQQLLALPAEPPVDPAALARLCNQLKTENEGLKEEFSAKNADIVKKFADMSCSIAKLEAENAALRESVVKLQRKEGAAKLNDEPHVPRRSASQLPRSFVELYGIASVEPEAFAQAAADEASSWTLLDDLLSTPAAHDGDASRPPLPVAEATQPPPDPLHSDDSDWINELLN
jgi:hypothetical protein